MSDLDTVFSVNITRATASPTALGFGTPMFLAHHAFWPERLRAFNTATAASELVTLGVPASHPISIAVNAVRSLTRKPEKIVIGRRLLAPTMVVRLSPLVTTEGFVYRFTVVDKDGLATSIAYTVLAAATTTTIATAIAALIDPLLDITAAAAAGVITVTGAVGTFFRVRDLPPAGTLRVEETTTDPGLATDLAAIGTAAEEGGFAVEFYGVSMDIVGEASAKALLAWCQANGRVAVVRSSNSEVADGAISNDLASDLIPLAHDCGFVIFAGADTGDMRDAAMLATILSYDPGTSTAAYKTLTGIVADNLTSGQVTALRAKRVTYYTSARQTPYTFEGKLPNGEFIDLRISADLIAARIQEAIFRLEKNNPKIPFSQIGINVIAGVVQEVLNQNTSTPTQPRSLAGAEYDDQGNQISEGPTVIPLSIAETTTGDRANRELRGLRFRGRFAGAIHKAFIEGTISI